MLDAIPAIFLVQMDNGLGITSRAIAMTTGLEIFPQIFVVINLTIEDDPNAPVFIAQWLMTGFDVDDAQAAHCQPDVLLDKKAVIIRTPVNDLLVHGDQPVAVH